MQDRLGGTVVDHASLMHDQDGIVTVQMSQAVRNGNDDALVGTGHLMQKVHDIVLGPRIKAGSHLVANQEPGIGHQLHSQRQAPLLAPGKNLHVPVCNSLHARYLQGVVNAVVQIVKRLELAAELRGAFHILIHAQLVIGNAELGDKPDLRRFKILFRQIMPIPEKTAVCLRDMPAIAFNNVVFPQPDGPTTAMKCPLGTLKLTLSSNFKGPSWASISYVMPSACNIMHVPYPISLRIIKENRDSSLTC